MSRLSGALTLYRMEIRALLRDRRTILLSIGAGAVMPPWLEIPGIVIGAAIALGALVFVGPFEREGWTFAGAVIPIAYIAWSAWLLVLGVVLLVHAL